MNIRKSNIYQDFKVEKPKEITGLGPRLVRKLKYLSRPIRLFIRQSIVNGYIFFGKYKKGSEDSEFERMYYKGMPESESLRRGIVCMYDGRVYHGGLTDRIRGLLSVYKEAKKRNIPFYIKWVHPFNLDEYLVPASHDWRIKDTDISYSRQQVFPVIIQDLPDFYSKRKLKAALHNKAEQWHVYSNSDDARGEYRDLYNELFKPSRRLMKEVEKHLNALGSNYVAYTFRFLRLLGDFEDWSCQVLSDEDAKAMMRDVKEELMKEVRKVPDDWKILITSDSNRFLDFIKDSDPRFYIVPGEVKHVDLTEGRYDDVWMKTFVDQLLLMRARQVTLMRTEMMFKSGFPRFAAEVGGAEFTDHKF